MKMKYIRNIVRVFPFFVARLNVIVSGGSYDLVGYDAEESSKTSSTGTDCKSSATVNAYIVGAQSDLPLDGNMKIMKSDCAKGARVPVPIKVVWEYCNKDSDVQTPVDNMIVAIYKSNPKYEDVMDEDVEPGSCVRMTSYKNINFCKRGAAMSLKYEAKFEQNRSRSNSYCFAYDFLRVRRQWLSKEDEVCGTTTDIDCEIGEGEENTGEQCAGNIRSDLACKDMNIVFLFKYCNFNADLETSLKFDRTQTWHKLNGVKLRQLDRTVLTPTEKCRVKRVATTINPCTSNTKAELQVVGNLPQSPLQCQSNSEFQIIAAQRCEYDFMLTEIVQDRKGGNSFIEIYTPNCAGQIVTDDFQLVKYRGKGRPLQDVTNLKGLQIDNDGFAVFCLSDEGNMSRNECDKITGDLSPADSVPGESIAIIQGKVNSEEPFKVVDAFGSTKNGVDGPDFNLDKPRCVRKVDMRIQQAVWNSDMWSCGEATIENIDPGEWTENKSFGRPTIIQTPTSSRVEPKPSPTTSGGNQAPSTDLSSPIRQGSEPVSAPVPNKVDSCDYDAIITEIVTFDDEIVYIEVWSKDSCIYGNIILKKLFVEVIDSEIPRINLKNNKFDDNGFIVICSDSLLNKIVPSNDSCNLSYDFGPIGSSSVRLYKPTGTVDDIFSYPDEIPHIGLGRTARKPEFDQSKAVSIYDEWIFYSDGSMTPGTRLDFAPVSPGPNDDSCMYSTMITEIVTFNDKVIYIEVRATEQCAYGKKIGYDLFLEIVDSDTRINLRGNKFDSDGFIVVCSTRSFLVNKMNSSIDKCGPSLDFGPIRSSTVRLYKITGTIDSFGYTSGSCNPASRADMCFSSPGRVARKPDIDRPNILFDNIEWTMYRDGSMTPGADESTLISPTRSPAVNRDKVSNGKEGKGGKGKGKRGYR